MIAEGRIDVLIFFWDPMEPQPHDVDVKALLRIGVVYNVPMACNRSTADFMISSPLLGEKGRSAAGRHDRRGAHRWLIFFWDPMEPQPHDVDVKALLRIGVVYNVPMACNRSTADFMISSPLLGEKYEAMVKDYSGYLERGVP